jgi:hypothetical protein
MLRPLFLLPLAVVIVVAPVEARPTSPLANLFRRPAKPNPIERVPQLLALLKNDTDESVRVSAADELKQYNPRDFAELLPTLTDALLNDTSASVRNEAASSLGRLRPISPAVGQALEKAVSADASMRVRLTARSALIQYHLNGYRSNTKVGEVTAPQTGEPPLAPVKPVPAPVVPPSPALVPAKPVSRGLFGPKPQTTEPPLAESLVPKVQSK